MGLLEQAVQDKEKAIIAEQLAIQKALSSTNVNEIYKAQTYLKTISKRDNNEIKSILVDPMDLTTALGFKDKKFSVSYDLLRAMSKTHIIKSIIETRKEQITTFCTPQESKFSTGFIIRKKRRFSVEKNDKKLTKAEEERIEDITEFMINCGNSSNVWEGDTFETFTSKIIDDSLTLDQASFELNRNRKGELCGFFATDGATYRLADTYGSDDDDEEKESTKKRIKGFLPSYVQIYQQSVVSDFYPWELGFCIRNPKTDIRRNGYGVSELEDMIHVVTALLNSDQYNANFFKIGSAPRGILKYSGNINTNTVEDLRRQWQAQVTGVMNCLHGSSRIVTRKDGFISLESLFKKVGINNSIEVWTGEKFEKGKVYKTDSKRVYRLKLNNGLKVKSSSEHRFRVLDQEGNLTWKEMKDLVLGDYVLVNRKSITDDKKLYYNEKELKEDFFEILGWLIGDGWIDHDKGENGSKSFMLYYHSTKEQEILQQHLSTLKSYGINASYSEYVYTEEQKENAKKKYGFKTIANKTTSINVIDAKFYDFLREFGFNSSKEKKNIPSKVFLLKSTLKCALLKGLFSADGSNSTKRTPEIGISFSGLRKDVRQLLISEGIRTSSFNGALEENGFGSISFCGGLIIKDRNLFFEKVGFIQDYKNQNIIPKKNYGTPKSLSKQLTRFFGEKIRKQNKITKVLTPNEQHDIRSACCVNGDNLTLERVCSFFDKVGLEKLSWMDDYYAEQVVELKQYDEVEQMYDIEIFDNEHQFIVNGVATHNSHKIPMINADKLDFISTHMPNKDMEFSRYQEFLIKISCAMYKIDPSEVGFPMSGSSDSKPMFETNNETKIKYSKDKGLKPLLRRYEFWLNKWVVSQLDEDFEIKFVGIDEEEETDLDRDIKKLSNFMTLDEIREKQNLKPVGKDRGGDIILNPTYSMYLNQLNMQKQQEGMMGGGDMGGGIYDDEGEEENEDPFAQFSDSGEEGDEDPFLKSLEAELPRMLEKEL